MLVLIILSCFNLLVIRWQIYSIATRESIFVYDYAKLCHLIPALGESFEFIHFSSQRSNDVRRKMSKFSLHYLRKWHVPLGLPRFRDYVLCVLPILIYIHSFWNLCTRRLGSKKKNLWQKLAPAYWPAHCLTFPTRRRKNVLRLCVAKCPS